MLARVQVVFGVFFETIVRGWSRRRSDPISSVRARFTDALLIAWWNPSLWNEGRGIERRQRDQEEDRLERSGGHTEAPPGPSPRFPSTCLFFYIFLKGFTDWLSGPLTIWKRRLHLGGPGYSEQVWTNLYFRWKRIVDVTLTGSFISPSSLTDFYSCTCETFPIWIDSSSPRRYETPPVDWLTEAFRPPSVSLSFFLSDLVSKSSLNDPQRASLHAPRLPSSSGELGWGWEGDTPSQGLMGLRRDGTCWERNTPLRYLVSPEVYLPYWEQNGAVKTSKSRHQLKSDVP